jgi:hypothetical protein
MARAPDRLFAISCVTFLVFMTHTSCFGTDTDRDGIADATDNCTLIVNWLQVDADHDGYGNACDADFDQNGIVDSADRAQLEASLGSTDRLNDLDGNGVVDAADLAILNSLFGLPPGPTGVEPAEDLYVAASAPVSGGDGSFANPYRRITDAVVRARSARETGAIPPDRMIRIHVAPGTYVGTFVASSLSDHPEYEILPIVLDVPRLAVFGSTHLVRDARGLPTGSEPGGTILTSNLRLSPFQFLVHITRTSGDAIGNEVTVEGFSFDDFLNLRGAANTASLFVDRVSDFRIRNNFMQHEDFGAVTRLASGVLEGNLLIQNGEATSVTGGSLTHPATVFLLANRATRNTSHGFMNIATGVVAGIPHAGSNPPDIAAAISQPLQTTFDRNDPGDLQNIPDTLTVVMVENDASANGQLGIRFMGNVHPLTYRTADETQPLTGALRAFVLWNTSVGNGYYGVDVEGGFTERTEPRRFVQDLSLHFEGNSFAGNGSTGALFTFRHWAASVGFEPLQRFKFAEDSTYEVSDPQGELAGFDLDHPATDPLSGTVLDNLLTVNGVEVPNGTIITTP